ncbi:unnamed protein product [Trifolium pratense]|uniref:Uncharacterized protein n=1 Tax=Trifolium pratense TaxID=57577 RepID=A0ACB0IJN3_TRIPR|nr:unnamed protein product [Trifolium pratense]
MLREEVVVQRSHQPVGRHKVGIGAKAIRLSHLFSPFVFSSKHWFPSHESNPQRPELSPLRPARGRRNNSVLVPHLFNIENAPVFV